MSSQKLMSFTSTWLNKSAFSSLYEIQAENQFNVFDAMCFASLLASPKIQSNVEKMQKSIAKKCSQKFFYTPVTGPLVRYQYRFVR